MSTPQNLHPANERRRASAAERAVPALRALLEQRGDALPPQLVLVGRLRVAHPDDSLAQLGERVEPRLSKDAVASRLRRLLLLGQDAA